MKTIPIIKRESSQTIPDIFSAMYATPSLFIIDEVGAGGTPRLFTITRRSDVADNVLIFETALGEKYKQFQPARIYFGEAPPDSEILQTSDFAKGDLLLNINYNPSPNPPNAWGWICTVESNVGNNYAGEWSALYTFSPQLITDANVDVDEMTTPFVGADSAALLAELNTLREAYESLRTTVAFLKTALISTKIVYVEGD